MPERLAKLTVTLTGKVEVLSNGGEKRDLSASHTWTINGIDKTDATSDGHLSKFGGNYVYELLGKNGEPLADQQVVFNFHHRDFARPRRSRSRPTRRAASSSARCPASPPSRRRSPNGRETRWSLEDAGRTWSRNIHAPAGEMVRVPWMGANGSPAGPPAFPARMNAGTFTADHTAKLAIKDG